MHLACGHQARPADEIPVDRKPRLCHRTIIGTVGFMKWDVGLSGIRSLRQWLVGERIRPRTLVIDDWLPDPRIGAGAPRALALLRGLQRQSESLTLLTT